jgi:hypothetical protein
MAILNGSRGFILGFVAGMGAGMVARDLMANPRSILKPAVKAVFRTGAELTERTREWGARLGELVQDTFAEVRDELRVEAEALTRRKAAPVTSPRRVTAQGARRHMTRAGRRSRKLRARAA